MLQINISTQEEYKNLFDKVNSKFPSDNLSFTINIISNINNGCACKRSQRINHARQVIKNSINLFTTDIYTFLKEEYKAEKFNFIDLT